MEGDENTKKLRIIIAGSRDFNSYKIVEKELHKILAGLSKTGTLTGQIDEDVKNMEIVSGTARGADQLGEVFAKNYGIKVKRFPADWDGLGKRAGYVRNADMAKYSVSDGNVGMLVAFWDGKSKGTKHMINLANRYGLDVHIVNF